MPGAHLGNVEGCVDDGTTATISLNNSAVLDWERGFKILQNQNLRFQFKNADGTSGTVLNRDLSGGASLIAGGLSSNGRIVLINPLDGISISGSAVIDADGGFLASTLEVDDEQALLDGDTVEFNGPGGPQSSIRNFGTIRSSGGDIVLISSSVLNAGALRAPNGAIRIGAGTGVRLFGDGESRITVLESGDRSNIVNTGNIAARGTVELNTNALAVAPEDTPRNVIDNSGTIRTMAANGRVFLRSPDGGNVINSADGVIETTDLVIDANMPIDNDGRIVFRDDGSNPSAPSGSRQFPRLGTGRLSNTAADDFRLSRLSFSHLNGLESKTTKKPSIKTTPRRTSAVAVRGSNSPKKKPAPKKVILRRGSFFGKKTS